MGYPLMFYVAEDIREKLKTETNRSELINNLLREFYDSKEVKTMTPEQRAERIRVLEIELEAERKIKEGKNESKN